MTDMRTTNRILAAALLVAAAFSAGACGDMARSGQAPVYVVLESLTASQGNKTGAGSNVLLSDVITNVITPAPCSSDNPCPTVFNDMGSATFSLALKDITSPTGPTTNNTVTLTRYRVSYRRADGRNTPGVDVPYGFDGAVTTTVGTGDRTTVGFELVRHAAKSESPLVQLRSNPQVITTIAEVTFYGQDRVGNDVVVTGNIQVDFANFGDQ